jgi:tetratricopeptide (TPR) repeat protein
LGLRYRLDFARPDTDLSSPVQENIATLQGFFRDNFQCDLEPYHVDPDVLDQPIIPDKWQGKAPFFLYYDEWLRQQKPFYPENHLDVRHVLSVGNLSVEVRGRLAELAGGRVSYQIVNVPKWKFCQDVLAIWDKLQEGHGHFYASEYGAALNDYRNALDLALDVMRDNILQKRTMAPFYNQRKGLPLNSMKDLPHFMNPEPELSFPGFGYGDDPEKLALDRVALRLAYYALFTIPVCLGDAEFALGDYEQAIFHYGQATRFFVGIAHETDSSGYRPAPNDFEMYWRGDKPYTVRLPASDDYYPREREDGGFLDTTGIEYYARLWARHIPHLAEIRYCRLRQANVMLEWADALYRLNEPTRMARARGSIKACSGYMARSHRSAQLGRMDIRAASHRFPNQFPDRFSDITLRTLHWFPR